MISFCLFKSQNHIKITKSMRLMGPKRFSVQPLLWSQKCHFLRHYSFFMSSVSCHLRGQDDARDPAAICWPLDKLMDGALGTLAHPNLCLHLTCFLYDFHSSTENMIYIIFLLDHSLIYSRHQIVSVCVCVCVCVCVGFPGGASGK